MLSKGKAAAELPGVVPEAPATPRPPKREEGDGAEYARSDTIDAPSFAPSKVS